MIDALFVTFVLVGTSYAAYRDLKTSEVADAVSLVIGGGSVLYYLGKSTSLPELQAVDLYLVGGTILYAAGVASYLRLYTYTSERLEQLLDGTVQRVRKGDILGTALFAAAGILYYQSVQVGGMTPLVLSVVSGTALFAIGWAMYVAGMWGGADAFVLGAVGYAFPTAPPMASVPFPAPFPFVLLLTVFMVGSLYSLGYAVYVAFRDRTAIERFWQDLVAYRHQLLTVTTAYLVGSAVIGYAGHAVLNVPFSTVSRYALAVLGVLVTMIVLYRFLKVVEHEVMRDEIAVEQLEPGDVLAEDLPDADLAADRIVGVTPDEITQIQEAYDTVRVKTGVRFIIAFPVAIVLLLFFTDIITALSVIR